MPIPKPCPRLVLPLMCLALVLTACRSRDHPPPPSDARAPTPPSAEAPLAAAHYFGRQWPKNYLAGYRREYVAEDFHRLKADGFNAVVLLVAWGDFQPMISPCCREDERAFERLRFLLRAADVAGLKVVLRVGYGWSLNPEAGDPNDRIHRLLNDASARRAYQRFIERLGNEIRDWPHVTMSFMSWEDQWLHTIETSARPDYHEFLTTLPATQRPSPDAPLPRADDATAKRFHAYWDWLVIHKLYEPARAQLPNLSYEARIDKEPLWRTDAVGRRIGVEWLGHPGMLAQSGTAPLTLYWAPFWGAENNGNQLSATDSLRLLTDLLTQSQGAQARALFIDQFNFVDNTPGFEANSTLRLEDIPAFLDRAVCVLKSRNVVGYGIWTARDYHESPIYNPSFGFGLEGWQLQATPEAQRRALVMLPSGDFELRLHAGQSLQQTISPIRGRLPRSDRLPDRLCVEADIDAPAVLSAQAGARAPWMELRFRETGRHEVCAEVAAVPDPDGEVLSLKMREGSVALRNVQLFDHTQFGGLYDADGHPGPALPFVQAMNRDFVRPGMPNRCKPVKN